MSTSLAVLKPDVGKMQGEFAKSPPGHVTAEKSVRTAQTAISMTRNIDRVANSQALMGEICKAAADGLIFDGREAALVIDLQGDPAISTNDALSSEARPQFRRTERRRR